jgi:hypothetical protein
LDQLVRLVVTGNQWLPSRFLAESLFQFISGNFNLPNRSSFGKKKEGVFIAPSSVIK